MIPVSDYAFVRPPSENCLPMQMGWNRLHPQPRVLLLPLRFGCLNLLQPDQYFVSAVGYGDIAIPFPPAGQREQHWQLHLQPRLTEYDNFLVTIGAQLMMMYVFEDVRMV